jgi:hypothetical protein
LKKQYPEKAVARPRLQYLKQVARNRGADSYTAMKKMACNDSRWKAANQSKDRRIRRRRKEEEEEYDDDDEIMNTNMVQPDSRQKEV